jgi:hypothetical protein
MDTLENTSENPMSDSDILNILLNNCDPYTPANKTFYVDCSNVRGGSVFADSLCEMLSQNEGRVHALFTGHIGCGKSSELENLKLQLEQKTPFESMKRFLPVLVDMSQYLDEYDVTATDILLAIVAELADALREAEEIELQDPYLKRRWEKLKTFLGSEVDATEGELSWGWGKTKVQRLRTDPTAREKVRQQLVPETRNLLEEINRVFVAARTILKTHPPKEGGERYSDFVLILDNLEKIQRLADNEQGEASHRALFIESAPQLTGLNAKIVFTVPLSLVRAEAKQLELLYSSVPTVLPMIKTEKREPLHEPFEPGIRKLEEILLKRMPPGVTLTDVFEADALESLIYFSAGHVRSLMVYLREAIPLAKRKLPLTVDIIETAIAKEVSVVEPSLRNSDWLLLAELELSPRQRWDNHLPEQRRLLDNVYVLEYINGGKDKKLRSMAPWYAVNPVLREQYGFEDAMKALQEKEKATNQTGE